MSCEEEVVEEEPREFTPNPDELKGACYFMIQGEPPKQHSTFSTLIKDPVWPENLWDSGKLIYNIRNEDDCIGPPESRNDTTLRFDAKFESGNLARAYQLSEDSYHCILEYDPNASGSCQWFYFKITNMRREIKYTFYISGFHKGKSLYCNGARIFWYSTKQARQRNISWSRGGSNYAYAVTRKIKTKKRASLQFQIQFPYEDDEVCLCYALPYTYSDLMRSIDGWMAMARPGWMRVDKHCDTEGGRDCPILTITNPNSSVKEEDKKCVFITGRIHPGESNSSYMVHGLLDFLLSKTPEADYILEKTIVKCVPMMNIDGVVAGFYRISLHKFDLNRMWTTPDQVMHPVVYETKKLIQEISKQREISIYIDFHGHSRLHGTFAYGCPNDDDPLLRNKEKTYPRAVSFLCDAFSWDHCVFSFPKERKSAGRIVVKTEMDVLNSYCIETSFGGILAGSRAGCLYDEPLWKELGRNCGLGVYHHLLDQESPLVSYAEKEIAFLSPKPKPLSMNQERKEIEVEFSEDTKEAPKGTPNIFFHMKPVNFLSADVSAISETSEKIKTATWIRDQFPLG